ncbi:MAG: hypothetical protein ACT4P6_06795 [Gemmatimonadaceae bacterium]
MQAHRVVLLALGLFTVLPLKSTAQTAADSASVTAFYSAKDLTRVSRSVLGEGS